MAEITIDPEGLDLYVSGLFATEDQALRATLAEMARAEIPSIQVSASEGKLLQLLAGIIGARRILEIGTLGGYSTIWLARALPVDGVLISLEIDERHAGVARTNIAAANIAASVEVRVGPAAEGLRSLAAAGVPAFDLVFIDADKGGYVEYLELAAPLVRTGGLILADNALSPSPLLPDCGNLVARYSEAASRRPDLQSIIVPTLRDQLDGLVISWKVEPS
jgi:predicted O-methyltransferase YrrM